MWRSMIFRGVVLSDEEGWVSGWVSFWNGVWWALDMCDVDRVGQSGVIQIANRPPFITHVASTFALNTRERG